MLVVLSGPSGVGKGTLSKRLNEALPDWKLSRSWTTRAPRPGESLGAYHFVTRAEFETAIADGMFLEWAEVFGNLYGSPWPDELQNVIVEIDVQGAAQVKLRRADACLIGIMPPGETTMQRREILRHRLQGRKTDSSETIETRLDGADAELAQLQAQSHHVVVNDDIDLAFAEILRIMRAKGLIAAGVA
jgi:guanylate kinase